MLRGAACSYFGLPGWASGGSDDLKVKSILGDGSREVLVGAELWPGFSFSLGLGEEGRGKGDGL